MGEWNGKRKDRGLTFNVSTAVGIVFRISPREVRGDGDRSEDDQTELWVSIGLADRNDREWSDEVWSYIWGDI